MSLGSIGIARPQLESGLQHLLLFGLFWMFAAMAVVPSDGAWEHVYERVTILAFALPALLLMAIRPSSVQIWWRQASSKWVLLFLGWSMVSLLWSEPGEARDWIGRILGILLFLYGWTQVITGREQRIRYLLIGCAAVITVMSLAAIITYYPQVFVGGRIQGFGRLTNTNTAADAAAAATIWLCTLRCNQSWWGLVRGLMVAILLGFVLMTFSRGPWGALFVTLVVIVTCRSGRWAPWILSGVLLLGSLAVLLYLPELTARGWSYRPAIFAQSFHMFLQHPLLGIGQGTPVHITVSGLLFYHTHNMFSQLAVQLGLPGLLLWVGIWLTLGWKSWCHRHESLGLLVFATWVYASIAGQVGMPTLIDSPRVEWLFAWLPLVIGYSLKRRETLNEGAKNYDN